MGRAVATMRAAGLTALALLLVVEAVAAQETGGGRGGTVEGRVVDAETGEPLAGVDVVVAGTRFGATTNAAGEYAMEGLPAGWHEVRASRLGYGALRRRVRVESRETVELDFELALAPVVLPEVTAWAERAATRAERLQEAVESRAEASRAQTEVSGELARDFNSANAYDALRVVPGVSYLNGAGGRQGKPSRIRGASSWVIADVIEDFPSLRPSGIGAEDGGLTAGLGSSIPAISLRSIDVKKGSLGVRYSGGADGGVIVNRLKRGRPGGPRGTVWLEVNPIAEQLYMVDVGGGTETFDYYVAGKLLDGEYRRMRDAAARSLHEERFHSGLVRLGLNLGEDMRLEGFALRGRDRIGYTQPESDDAATPAVDESAALPANVFRTTNTNEFYGATFDHVVGRSASYELGYSFVENHALRFSITDGAAHRDRPQRTHAAFGNLYLTRGLSGSVDYSAKLGFEAVRHDQREYARGSDKEQSFLDRSVFYGNTLSFGRSLFVNGGLRYVDAEDDYGDHRLFVYDAGVSYRLPVLGTTTRASYSTGYSRNKGFAYFFGPIEAAGGVEPTENRTVEIGVDQPVALGGRGRASITAFRTLSDGVPTFSGWGAEVVHYEDREVRGLELSADHLLSDALRLFGSFTWMDTEIVATTHPEGINVGNTGVRVPRYAGALGVDFIPTERLRVSAVGTYDDGMRNEIIDERTGELIITTNEAYTRVNLAADYDVSDEVTARLRVENLLDRTDLGYSHETIGPDGYASTDTVALDPGRFLSLALLVSF